MAGPASQTDKPDPWAEFEEVGPANFWENDPIAPQGEPSTDPVFVIPDPAGARQDARDRRGENRDEVRLGISQASEERQADKDEFDRGLTLGQRYDALPEVQGYREGLTYFMTGLQTAPNGAGDSTLVTSYAKVMDPGGVVNEGERDAASGTGSWIQQRATQLRNILDNKGSFTPEMRNQLRTEMNRKMEQNRRAYEAARGRFSRIADANGIDADLILGSDDFEPYRGDYEAWVQQNETPEAATMQDAVRENGARVELGMDKWGDNDVFDRNAYLQEQFGIDGNAEARLSTSLNRLAGQDVSTSQIAAIYGQLGIPLPTDADLEGIATDLREGTTFGGIDTTDAEQQYLEGLREFNEGSAAENYGAAALATQGAALGFGDEVAGIAEGARALASGNSPVTGYQVGRDAERLALEEARARTGGWGTAAEIAGGLTTGGVRLLPALARTGAKVAPTAINEARAAGAVAGFGYGEGPVGSTAGAAIGAATGDFAARGIGALARKLQSRAPSAAQAEGREVIEAADRTNARTGSNIQPISYQIWMS